MTDVLLSLGSNIDAERHLRDAVTALRARFGVIDVSPVYRTIAVGFEGDDFLNAAARITTDLDAGALDAWLHALEDASGRRRDVPRFSSRTLDIDIVLFGDGVFEGPGNLKVPRPELKHAFVLKPLVDLAPDRVVPGTGMTLSAMWQEHPQYRRPEWQSGTPIGM